MKTPFRWLAALVLALGALARPAAAQDLTPDILSSVTVQADQLDYDRDTEMVRAAGNVVIGQGGTELRADSVTINRKSALAEAQGNVRLKRDEMTWEGDKLVYNLATREIQTDRFASAFPPYHVWAESGAKGTGIVYILKSATFSTCNKDLEHLHYRIRAREVTVVPDSYITAKHAVLYAGIVPVFYTPRLSRSLEEDKWGVQLQPGYRSRMGGYLLTGVSYKFTNWFEATTLVDYRSLRGWAGGEEFDWKNPGGQGKFHGYLLQDVGVDEEDNDYPTNRVPDESRYRVRVKQWQEFGDGWTAMGEFNKLSDEFVLEDFYRRDFRDNPEPLNYLLVGKAKDNQAMSLLVKGRVDDFYDTISRLPEARHEVFLTPIWDDSGFYYQGYNDIVYLMREPAEFREEVPEDEEEVDLLRADSSQFVTYPTSAGIFHLVPRGGVRATWFSKTRDEVVWDREGPVTNTLADGTTVVTNGLIRTVYHREGGAMLRPLFEVGSEASFKAFRVWEAGEGATLSKYRHIAEPYGNYTLRPNLLDQSPDDFYQIDEVDAYGSEHSFRLGMRNTIQFKREAKIYELFDADVYSTYYMESQEEEEGIGPLGLLVESRPADEVYMRMDGKYDFQDAEWDEYSFRGRFLPHPMWSLSGEYRYRRELSSLTSGSVKYMPNDEWAYLAYVRYNIDDGEVEEHSYQIERKLDCMGIRFGVSHEPGYELADGRERDDDFGVNLELWLMALPGARWGSGGSR